MQPSTRLGSTLACSNISPIQRIPFETLSLIFSYYPVDLKSDDHLVGTMPTNPMSILPAPLLLGCVNRTWHNVARSTHCLWTSISITLNEKHPHVNQDAVSSWLERSGNLLLDISIVDEVSRRLDKDQFESVSHELLILKSHNTRWRSLYLKLDWSDGQDILDAPGRLGGFPMLEELILDCRTEFLLLEQNHKPYTAPFLSLFPQLSKVSFAAVAGFWLDEADPTYSLEEVRGDFFVASLEDCFRLIQNSPKLRVLDANVFSDFFSPFVKFEPVFTHHLITELHFGEISPPLEMAAFFDSLTLPSLKSLVICHDIVEEAYSVSLVNLVRRSSPPMGDLRIGGCSEAHLLELLRLLPALRTFSTSLEETNDLLEALTCRYPPSDPGSGSELAPCLEVIMIISAFEPDIPILHDMVLSRWGGHNGRFPNEGRLHSIVISCDVDILTPELKLCQEEGLKIDSVWM